MVDFSRSTLISIHALREESDRNCSSSTWSNWTFQSTLSVRRATCYSDNICAGCLISIHALREESDTFLPCISSNSLLFQSTLSVRRATRHYKYAIPDVPQFQSTLSVRRATKLHMVCCSAQLFQSTLSVRRATRAFSSLSAFSSISIHALREESDGLNL